MIDPSAAARALGSLSTEKKARAARANWQKAVASGKLGRPKGSGSPLSEEAKAKMRAAQQARRKREQEERG